MDDIVKEQLAGVAGRDPGDTGVGPVDEHPLEGADFRRDVDVICHAPKGKAKSPMAPPGGPSRQLEPIHYFYVLYDRSVRTAKPC